MDRPYMMSGHQNFRHLHDPSSDSRNTSMESNNIIGVPNEPKSLSPLHQLKMLEKENYTRSNRCPSEEKESTLYRYE